MGGWTPCRGLVAGAGWRGHVETFDKARADAMIVFGRRVVGVIEVSTSMRQRLFIGSSTEGLAVADALHEMLAADFEVTVWNQGVVEAAQYVLEGLLNELSESDFGVFVFSPDDVARIRDREQPVVRDNVLFELGLFVGRLGRRRSFIIRPDGVDLRVPSDLLGMVTLTYDAGRRRDRMTSAVGPAVTKLKRAIEAELKQPAANMPERSIADLPVELQTDWFQRRALLSDTQIRLLRVFEEGRLRPDTKILLGLGHCESEAELFYRLEHLRLLGFIVRRPSASIGGADSYEMSGRYAEMRSSLPGQMLSGMRMAAYSASAKPAVKRRDVA